MLEQLAPRELSDGIILRPIRHDDAPAVAAAYVANRAHLAPWEPVRTEAFFTVPWWRAEIDRVLEATAAGTMAAFILERDGAGHTSEVIGRFTLTGIEHGVFQNSRLGYWVAADAEGRGLASAAVGALVATARDDLGLHRMEASTLTHNLGSQRVLERNGFERIGTAPEYLRIAGWWQDHHLYQRILHA
jgi:ribosomal-protein-alanine N-acetyltransferase